MEVAKKAGEEGANEISEQLGENLGAGAAKVVNKVYKKKNQFLIRKSQFRLSYSIPS